MIELLQTLLAFGIPVAGGIYCFRTWLDRMHPAKQPDPSGADLLLRLQAHEEEMKREINALSGRLSLKDARPRLRE